MGWEGLSFKRPLLSTCVRDALLVVTGAFFPWSCSRQKTEAATRSVLWKKVFLEISQNSQENTCARVSFLIKLQLWGLSRDVPKQLCFWWKRIYRNSHRSCSVKKRVLQNTAKFIEKHVLESIFNKVAGH